MITKEQARTLVYLAGALVGATVTVLGAIRGDAALIGTGLALLGTDALAAANVRPRGDHAE